MAQELYRDRFGAILHHSGEQILELEWFEGSATMTDDDFMRSMERYAAFAEEHRAPNMLVDVTRFKHTPGEQVAQWRDQHIIPRYDAAGVKKFAFLIPSGAPGDRWLCRPGLAGSSALPVRRRRPWLVPSSAGRSRTSGRRCHRGRARMSDRLRHTMAHRISGSYAGGRWSGPIVSGLGGGSPSAPTAR